MNRAPFLYPLVIKISQLTYKNINVIITRSVKKTKT